MINNIEKSVLYVRCSTTNQKSDRQTEDYGKSLKDNFQFFLEDAESGSTPIFERKSGQLLKVMIDELKVNHIHIHQIDRCARNLKSLLEFIEYTSKRGVNVYFKKEGINTLGDNGKPSYMVKMIISVMGAFQRLKTKSVQNVSGRVLILLKSKVHMKIEHQEEKKLPIDF